MIEYALSSSTWRRSASRHSFYLEELFSKLMGLDSASLLESQPIFAERLKDFRPLFKRWSDRWLQSERAAESFGYFLTNPVSDNLLQDGVCFLAVAAQEYGNEKWRGETQLDETMVRVLRRNWTLRSGDIENNPDLRGAFLNFLSFLIGRQARGALQLRDDVLQAIGD